MHYELYETVSYKREMVTLYVPFRKEVVDILDRNKFLDLYDTHEQDILQRRKKSPI
jgi:hypothetical protein